MELNANHVSKDLKYSNSDDDTLLNICHLLKRSWNDQCVDCKDERVTHINCMLGVFLCTSCASYHTNLGPGMNKVLLLNSDNISKEDIRILTTIGNKGNKETYEKRLPPCYRRPSHDDPMVFMVEWMHAKYVRKEFMEGMHFPSYLEKTKEGNLWKRGKENRQFKLRRFILCKQTKVLKYFVKDGPNCSPKAELNLDVIDAFVVPEKIGNPNGMQIMFESKGFTRSLFVHTDTSEELISWYTAIYAAKLQWLQIAFPCTPIEDLCKRLWPRIVKEGWLMKSGPKKTDKFYSRWVTLFNRKMIYSTDSLDPFPNGEVFIGSHDSGAYWVKIPETFELPDIQSQGFVFLVSTPQRVFTFSTKTEEERKEWVDAIGSIMCMPLLPFEQKEAARRGTRVITKRFSSIFVG